MINLPTYKTASGMADFITRKIAFTIVIHLLVSQTSLKKRGRFLKAESRSLKDNCVDAGLLFFSLLNAVRQKFISKIKTDKVFRAYENGKKETKRSWEDLT